MQRLDEVMFDLEDEELFFNWPIMYFVSLKLRVLKANGSLGLGTFSL